MNLLISDQGEVLGHTLSPENAHRLAMVSRSKMYVVVESKDFGKLPKQCIRGLNEDYGAKSFRSLWSMVTKKSHPYWGKVSVMQVMRTLFQDHDTAYSKEELLKVVPGATWISITTAMSMLKNKSYCDGKILVIAQIDGKYRRR